jgi:hypothetical protein
LVFFAVTGETGVVGAARGDTTGCFCASLRAGAGRSDRGLASGVGRGFGGGVGRGLGSGVVRACVCGVAFGLLAGATELEAESTGAGCSDRFGLVAGGGLEVALSG